MTQLTLFPSVTVEKVEKHHREFTSWRTAVDHALSLPLGIWEVSIYFENNFYNVKAVRL